MQRKVTKYSNMTKKDVVESHIELKDELRAAKEETRKITTHAEVLYKAISDKDEEIAKMHSEYDAKMAKAEALLDTVGELMYPKASGFEDSSPEFRALGLMLKIFARPKDIDAEAKRRESE